MWVRGLLKAGDLTCTISTAWNVPASKLSSMLFIRVQNFSPLKVVIRHNQNDTFPLCKGEIHPWDVYSTRLLQPPFYTYKYVLWSSSWSALWWISQAKLIIDALYWRLYEKSARQSFYTWTLKTFWHFWLSWRKCILMHKRCQLYLKILIIIKFQRKYFLNFYLAHRVIFSNDHLLAGIFKTCSFSDSLHWNTV